MVKERAQELIKAAAASACERGSRAASPTSSWTGLLRPGGIRSSRHDRAAIAIDADDDENDGDGEVGRRQ